MAQAVYATDFRHHSSSSNSMTFNVTLTSASPANRKDHLALVDRQGNSKLFQNSGFDGLGKITIPAKAELTLIRAERADATAEMDELRRLIRPLAELSTRDEDHVQTYYGVDYTRQNDDQPGVPRTCYVLKELCEGSPLDEFMEKYRGIPHEYTVIRYANMILEGLEFLHRNHIIHRDIRASNVVISANGKNLKITGLTMAKHFEEPETPDRFLDNAAGTVPFVSPEMAELSTATRHHRPHVGRKTDIWSFGCVLVQLLQGGQPPSVLVKGSEKFDTTEKCNFQVLHTKFKAGYKLQYPSADACGHGCESCPLVTHEIVAFIDSCLVRDPSMRPTALNILENSFMYLKYRIILKAAQQQRLYVRWYNLTPLNEIDEVPASQGAKTSATRPKVTVVSGPNDRIDSMKQIQETLKPPEQIAGVFSAGTVSIVTLSDSGGSRLDILKKHTLYQLLVDNIAQETQYVIQHLAVTLASPAELRIFTENEAKLTPLDVLINSETKITERRLIPKFTAQILEGLSYLHSYGIIHKDIRGSNIFVRKPSEGDQISDYLLKIAHFEKASYFSGDSTPRNFINHPEGSSRFASKEMQELLSFDIKEPESIGRATDVFSLGCTVVEMYEKSEPRWIYQQDGKSMKYEFRQPDTNLTDFTANMYNLLTFQAEPDTSEVDDGEALNFVQLCFKRPAISRPTCERLLLHSFIRGLKPSLPA